MNELPQIFYDAKLLGVDFLPEKYREQSAKRGDREFVVSRGMLMEFAWNPHRWRAGFERKATDATDLGNVLEVLPLMHAKWESMFAVEPENYCITVMECPQCGSQTESQTCAKCKCSRHAVSIEKPWRYGAKHCDEWKSSVEHDGKIPISKEISDAAMIAREVLRQDERIEELLSISQKQVCVTATYLDHATKIKVPVKCLIDLVPPKEHLFFGHCLADYKTSRSINNETWLFTVDTYNLDAQAALELDLWDALTGEERDGFLHVAQESYSPFETGRKFIGLQFINLGRGKIMRALELYCRCLKENRWPSPDNASSNSLQGWTLIEPTEKMINRALYSLPEIEDQKENQKT